MAQPAGARSRRAGAPATGRRARARICPRPPSTLLRATGGRRLHGTRSRAISRASEQGHASSLLVLVGCALHAQWSEQQALSIALHCVHVRGVCTHDTPPQAHLPGAVQPQASLSVRTSQQRLMLDMYTCCEAEESCQATAKAACLQLSLPAALSLLGKETLASQEQLPHSKQVHCCGCPASFMVNASVSAARLLSIVKPVHTGAGGE